MSNTPRIWLQFNAISLKMRLKIWTVMFTFWKYIAVFDNLSSSLQIVLALNYKILNWTILFVGCLLWVIIPCTLIRIIFGLVDQYFCRNIVLGHVGLQCCCVFHFSAVIRALLQLQFPAVPSCRHIDDQPQFGSVPNYWFHSSASH